MFFCFNIFIILANIFSNNVKAEKNYLITNEISNCNAVTNSENIANIAVENDLLNIDNLNVVKETDENINEWKLEIPKIDLSANISEGTSKETLNEYIGHFEESSKIYGNVCLAGHNRGYKVNYFARLKELEIGDKIYYTYNYNKKVYIVTSKTIIKDTDWKMLENTKDNRITLITCVENEPQYRRCVQALECK